MQQQQQQQHHSALAPISEGAIRAQQQPRRSLRYPSTLTTETEPEQPRRYTLMPTISSGAGQTADGPRQRRPSRRRPSSIRSSERSQGQGGAAAFHQLENTYRLGPTQPFKVEAAEALIKERLGSNLKRYNYNAQSAKVMSTNLAQEIKNKIKQQILMQGPNNRYKLIVLVTVAAPTTTSGEFASRMLCQASSGDACAKAEFRSSGAAAWAAVFAFYCE